MKVIATVMGIVISFASIGELQGVIKHLQDQLEWIERENINPPYLYSQSDERIPKDEISKMLDEIKSDCMEQV